MMCFFTYFVERRLRGKAINTFRSKITLCFGLQDGNTYFKKLIHIGAEYAQELKALKQWRGGIQCHAEHSLVERQQAQFRVQIQV